MYQDTTRVTSVCSAPSLHFLKVWAVFRAHSLDAPVSSPNLILLSRVNIQRSFLFIFIFIFFVFYFNFLQLLLTKGH
jgi:hypothetical protein